MTRILIWLPLALFAILLVVVATGIVKPGDRTIHSRMVGKPLPAFTLKPMVANKPGLSPQGFREGGPRLLNVFATWCIPCIAEAPELMELKRRGVAIDAVAVRDTPGDVRKFLARHGDPYARIGDDAKGEVQLEIGSSGVPETFVIDGQGKIAMQHIGAIRRDDIPDIMAALERAK
ncbi:DsbE family thiol:disulfide interchange protein [Stakelama marina]|uniref:DsbE family thiol:disulfide interchange protein n=1 Tax=Stakelama marina TaxID=2826939 RepID=A0A8T4ICX3_9SPHN|nr:DsbE family thiol:disulfide interchange protein [Stakelama marina]MBR0551952.1 DsbE family thiol:disulfide interchange protein [Stakelama marina]